MYEGKHDPEIAVARPSMQLDSPHQERRVARKVSDVHRTHVGRDKIEVARGDLQEARVPGAPEHSDFFFWRTRAFRLASSVVTFARGWVLSAGTSGKRGSEVSGHDVLKGTRGV